MSKPELPFCASCPVSERIIKGPEIAKTDAVQQVAGYIDDFAEYLEDFIRESFGEQDELMRAIARGEQVYGQNHTSITANDAFVESAQDTRRQILGYVDLLPAGVSDETIFALARCAHCIGNGDCFFTGTLPGFKEILSDNL